jgi:hypothetical protein
MTIMDVCAGRSFERPAQRHWRRILVALIAAGAVSARTARADDVIEDPELAAVPHEKPVAPPPANGPHETTWRTTIHTRWGVDTDWTRASQDIVEGTTVATLEAEQRRSDALLLSVGLRARHGFFAHQSGAASYTLDVAPLSLFADVTPGAGYHFRVGYQQITLGRFDLFSATNFLATYDLRSGPVTMSEAAPIATPAVRFDFDKFRGFTLQAFYLPFFVPDLVALYGTDYALLSGLDRLRLPGVEAERQVLERAFTRSGLTTLGTDALQALAPAPDFRSPQGGIRATLYGSAGELSATVGTALEPLPTVILTPAFTGYLNSVATAFATAAQQMTAVQLPAASDAVLDRPLRVEHNRYGLVSVDGAFDVGPIQIGAEAAYMLDRTLLATTPATAAAPAPVGVPERVSVSQFGLRGEYVKGSEWAVVVESFFAMALRNPSLPGATWFGLDGRYGYGVGLGAQYTPEKSRLRFELGGAAFAVASYVVMPRIEWEALNAFFLELGAVIIQGQVPTLFTRNWSMGGLYNDADQVFVGVRWSP